MKVQFESNIRTDKSLQFITSDIISCRDSAGFSVLASNKLFPINRDRLCNLTGQCFDPSGRMATESYTQTFTYKSGK